MGRSTRWAISTRVTAACAKAANTRATGRVLLGMGSFYPNRSRTGATSVIAQHSVEEFPPARHLIVFLESQPVARFLDLIMTLQQVRAHLQQALLIGVEP